MRRIDHLFAEYGESHSDETNKTIHWICVPVIFFSIIGMLASIPSGIVQSFLGDGNPYANWAGVALIFVIVYYVSLSIPLGIGMMLFGVLCMMLSDVITRFDIAPLWVISLVLFVLAWIGQLYGHKVERKRPSFLKDLQFLLIGPAWLLHFVYKRLGIPY
jgi:uncharacterized membrane protein YGL010W